MKKLFNIVITIFMVGTILIGCVTENKKSTSDTNKSSVSNNIKENPPDLKEAQVEVEKIFDVVINEKYNYTPENISAKQAEINKLALNNKKVLPDSFVQNVKDKNITSEVGNVDNGTEKIDFKDAIKVEGVNGRFYGATAKGILNYSENGKILVGYLIVTAVFDTKTKTWKLVDIKSILNND